MFNEIITTPEKPVASRLLNIDRYNNWPGQDLLISRPTLLALTQEEVLTNKRR
jgi:hypothetical protein